jgi:hypothetical protein
MHLGLPLGAAFLLPELVRALTYAFFEIVHDVALRLQSKIVAVALRSQRPDQR